MLDFAKVTFREFVDDDAPRLAAALSYYTVFALPAVLMLVLMLAGAVWDPGEVEGLLVREIGGLIGAGGADQIREMLASVDRPGDGGPWATILGVAALMFGATGAFGQLQAALNKAWDVEPASRGAGLQGMVVKRVLSFGMVLVIAFFLLVSLVLSALLTAAGESVAASLPDPLGPAVLGVTNLAVTLAVVTLLFMALYRVLPDADVAWSDVWRGALATAALFLVGEFLLGLYIARRDPGSAFGAAGSLTVVMVWVYYSAMIVLLGAELTQVYADRRGRGIRPSEGAVRAGEAT